MLSAVFAALAGSLFAIWLRYVGPDTTLRFEIMIDILLMVVIGGMGTIWGAVLGAALFLLAQSYLQELMGAAAAASRLPLPPAARPGPLAVVAGGAVRAERLLLSQRHRRAAARPA